MLFVRPDCEVGRLPAMGPGQEHACGVVFGRAVTTQTGPRQGLQGLLHQGIGRPPVHVVGLLLGGVDAAGRDVLGYDGGKEGSIHTWTCDYSLCATCDLSDRWDRLNRVRDWRRLRAKAGQGRGIRCRAALAG